MLAPSLALCWTTLALCWPYVGPVLAQLLPADEWLCTVVSRVRPVSESNANSMGKTMPRGGRGWSDDSKSRAVRTSILRLAVQMIIVNENLLPFLAVN